MSTDDQLVAVLAAEGPLGGPAIQRRLGLSQPVFSRLVRRQADTVRRVGRARATRYFLPRHIGDLGEEVPIHEVLPDGRTRLMARLLATRPEGYWVDSACEDVDSGPVPGLPWFLFGLRPAGFLGRLLPRQHPDLRLPDDIRLWSGDACLRFLARRGWDMPGALVLGDEAFEGFLSRVREPPARIPWADRGQRYPEIASDVLRLGAPGSSVAGEQPKFLTTRDDGAAVLVKFSPPVRDTLSERVADLLIAEHHALEILAARAQPAARSSLVHADDRWFLEVERFDRVGPHGRRGVISMMALDSEFVDPVGDWTDTTRRLARARVVPASAVAQVCWLERFGGLIANTDMHHGNLSFFMHGARVGEPCPAYDMTPMLYAPRNNQLIDRRFDPPLPRADDGGVWADVHAAALAFWAAVAADDRVSQGFRAIARTNGETLAGLAHLAAVLPGSASPA